MPADNNTLSERERIKSYNKKKYDFYLENKPKLIDKKNKQKKIQFYF